MVREGKYSYLKMAIESTWGDGTTPSVSIPILSDSIKAEVDMKDRSSELAGGQFAPTPLTGRQWSQGGFNLNAYPNLIGYFLLLHFGTPVATQVSPGVYDNVFEPGVSVDKSASLEVSKAGANPLMIAGYMANQLTWNQGKDGASQMLKLTANGGGRFPTEGSPTAFTYPTVTPLQFDEAVMTAASKAIYLDSIQWSDNNGLMIPNHKISNGVETMQPVINSRYKGEGSFVMDFEDLTDWDKFRLATDVAITATYTTAQIITGAYVYTLTVTMPKVRYKNPLPDISSPDKVSQTVGFDMYAGTVGSSTVPISYTLRCGTDFSAL